MEQYKVCTKCKQTKLVTEFHKFARSKDGLKPACKECNKKEAKQWLIANPEKAALSRKNWAIANPEKSYLIKKRWQVNNPSKVAQSSKAWQQNNKEHVKLVAALWALRNPDSRKQTSARRRANKYNNGVYAISHKDLNGLKNKLCFYCDVNQGIEIDHVIPISRGGRHSIGNLVLACLPCNRSKSNKFIMEWRIKKQKNPPKSYATWGEIFSLKRASY